MFRNVFVFRKSGFLGCQLNVHDKLLYKSYVYVIEKKVLGSLCKQKLLQLESCHFTAIPF